MSGVHEYVTRAIGFYQSQHGEDRWVEQYFGGLTNGVFVEVGAYDGVVLSNTFLLESLGWTGVLVEPIPEKARSCRENRRRAVVFECAAVASDAIREIAFHEVIGGAVYSTSSMSTSHSARLESYGLRTRSITVPARTLDSILDEAHIEHVDFVSIDVEGGEADVLAGFTLSRWRPRVVMVEVNARSRSKRVRDIFTRAGYVYLESIAINDIYVPLTEFRRLASVIDTLRYCRRRACKIFRGIVRRLVPRRVPG